MERIGEKKSIETKEKIIVKKIPTEIYSRVVGYFRPVSNWNKGKKKEFSERKEFKL